MIRKVPGLRAWVLKPKDINNLLKTLNDSWYWTDYYYLPLLDVNCSAITCYEAIAIKDDVYILLNIDDNMYKNKGPKYVINPDYIDIINKTWNEFYDQSWQ